MAQITVFPTQSNAPGNYTSATAQFGGTPTIVGYAIQSTVANWGTTINSAIGITIEAQQNLNDGAGWTPVWSPGSPFNPGEVDKFGNPPNGSFTLNDQIGARDVRAVMTVAGGSVNFGLIATTTPYTGK